MTELVGEHAWRASGLGAPDDIDQLKQRIVFLEQQTVDLRLFASAHYKVGMWLAGQNVDIVCDGALVQIHHRGVLVATHARRHDPAKQSVGMTRGVRGKEPQAGPTASVVTVTRKVDSSGRVSFAGASYIATNCDLSR